MRPHVTTSAANIARRSFLASGLAFAMIALMPPNDANAKPAAMTAPEAHEAAKAGDIVLVDIRTPEEWAETGIPEGAVALDMRAPDFVRKLVDIRKKYPKKPIAMICRTGNRSGYVTTTLDRQGFPGLIDVKEGVVGGPNGPGWLKRGLPIYPGTAQNVKERLDALLNAPGE